MRRAKKRGDIVTTTEYGLAEVIGVEPSVELLCERGVEGVDALWVNVLEDGEHYLSTRIVLDRPEEVKR